MKRASFPVTPIDQCAFYPLLVGGRNTASGLPQGRAREWSRRWELQIVLLAKLSECKCQLRKLNYSWIQSFATLLTLYFFWVIQGFRILYAHNIQSPWIAHKKEHKVELINLLNNCVQSLLYCSNSCTPLHFQILKSHTKTLKIRPYMFRSPLKPSSGNPWPYFARLLNCNVDLHLL
jgi:hypothetical protein